MLKWVPASLKPADIGMWCNDRPFEGTGGVKPGDKSWNSETWMRVQPWNRVIGVLLLSEQVCLYFCRFFWGSGHKAAADADWRSSTNTSLQFRVCKIKPHGDFFSVQFTRQCKNVGHLYLLWNSESSWQQASHDYKNQCSVASVVFQNKSPVAGF